MIDIRLLVLDSNAWNQLTVCKQISMIETIEQCVNEWALTS